MNKENKKLLTYILKYDLILSLIFLIIGWIALKNISIFFIIGLFVAYINLYINAISVEKLLNQVASPKVGMILSQLGRVMLVTAIGGIIVIKSHFGFLLFVIGYSAQLISMIIYGFKCKND